MAVTKARETRQYHPRLQRPIAKTKPGDKTETEEREAKTQRQSKRRTGEALSYCMAPTTLFMWPFPHDNSWAYSVKPTKPAEEEKKKQENRRRQTKDQKPNKPKN